LTTTTSSAAASTLSCARKQSPPMVSKHQRATATLSIAHAGADGRPKRGEGEGSIPGTMKLAPASTIRSDPLPASPPIPRASRPLLCPFRSIDARGGDLFGLAARCGSSLKWGERARGESVTAALIMGEEMAKSGRRGGSKGDLGERQRLLFGPCQKEKPACGFVEVDPIWGPGAGISEKVKDGAI
jgi:hypothetical protein